VYTVANVDSKNNAKAVQKTVELGYTTGAFVEIKSGLEPGELVVTDGAKALKDGITVEVIK
ncbi:MAG: efflux RND transporter periplasmic adaptor subunit, partial [Bacteroidetes bacterium HGW-Bacteroidetes-23]